MKKDNQKIGLYNVSKLIALFKKFFQAMIYSRSQSTVFVSISFKDHQNSFNLLIDAFLISIGLVNYSIIHSFYLLIQIFLD